MLSQSESVTPVPDPITFADLVYVPNGQCRARVRVGDNLLLCCRGAACGLPDHQVLRNTPGARGDSGHYVIAATDSDGAVRAVYAEERILESRVDDLRRAHELLNSVGRRAVSQGAGQSAVSPMTATMGGLVPRSTSF